MFSNTESWIHCKVMRGIYRDEAHMMVPHLESKTIFTVPSRLCITNDGTDIDAHRQSTAGFIKVLTSVTNEGVKITIPDVYGTTTITVPHKVWLDHVSVHPNQMEYGKNTPKILRDPQEEIDIDDDMQRFEDILK